MKYLILLLFVGCIPNSTLRNKQIKIFSLRHKISNIYCTKNHLYVNNDAVVICYGDQNGRIIGFECCSEDCRLRIFEKIE